MVLGDSDELWEGRERTRHSPSHRMREREPALPRLDRSAHACHGVARERDARKTQGQWSQCNGARGQREAPKDDPTPLPHELSLGGSTVERGDLSIGVAAPLRPPPPLRRAVHVRIVNRAVPIEPHETTPSFAKAYAELVILRGDDLGVIPAELSKGGNTDHDVTTESRRVPYRAVVPLDVADSVEHGAFREPFATPTTDGDYIGRAVQLFDGRIKPITDDLTVPIDELDVLQLGVLLEQALEACVPRPCGREWNGHVQFDDGGTVLARRITTAVSGCGVDVYDRALLRGEGLKSSNEALPLIASDEDNPDSRLSHERELWLTDWSTSTVPCTMELASGEVIGAFLLRRVLKGRSATENGDVARLVR